MRRSWALVAFAAVLLPALAVAGESRLFASRGAEADRVGPRGVGVVRARAVGFDAAALPGADGASPLPASGHTILLDLFDDVVLRARMVRAERIEKGMAWVGRLEGQPLSDVVLTVHDGILTGSVTWPDASYRIAVEGGATVVQQLDHSQFPEDGCFREVPGGAPAVAAEPMAQADDGSFIDVLVVYTPGARAAAGGTSQIQATINTAITETNTGYANSGVVQRLRLAAAVEVAYTEAGDIGVDLDRITATSDGYLDTVHTLRNTYKADMVSLLTETPGSPYCGIAWLMGGNNPGFATNAFSVVERTCATGYYSFGHELGHNMGLNHARTDPVGTGAYAYSYGHKWTGYRTVMAYAPGTRILHFSNPNVQYALNPTGVSEASPSSAHNALSLNNTRVTVANWRVGDTPTVTVTSPNGGQSWPAGSIQSISWSSAALNTGATIKLQYTNGTTTNTIVTGLARTTTSYLWTVPNNQAANWKVIVCSDVGGSCEASDQSNANFSIVAPPATSAARHDWNGDLKADILWHHQGNGDLYTWYLNGTVTTSGSYLTPSRFADTLWQIRGISDFNLDGKNDILWHHQGTGDLYVWFMGGTGGVVVGGGGYLTPSRFADTRWQIRGISDFNGDGQKDILWHHQADGRLYVWFMNGLTVTSGSYLTPSAFADTQWVIRGVADFNADGKSDVLWHHQGDGSLYVWFLGGTNGVVTQSGSYLTPSAFADTQWKIVQVADFNADGKNDVLWHHQGSGALYVWFLGGLNGVVTQTGGYLTPAAFTDTSWKVAPR